MTNLKLWFIKCLLLLLLLTCLISCASKKQTVILDTDVEIWELKFTGETTGTVKMALKRKEIEKGHYLVAGKITGFIQDHKAGPGEADYTLEGKIEKDTFIANFKGPSYMSIGPGFIQGKMQGTIFKGQGAGTWRVMHPMGFSAGKYSMRKSN
jgi:hypothetical protein